MASNFWRIEEMLKRGMKILLAVMIAGWLSAGVSAQTTDRPERGVRPNGSYSVSDLENISLNNGNMNLSIPLAGLPPMAGGKLSWTLRAIYNSKTWDSIREEIDPLEPTEPNYVLSRLQVAGPSGWRLAQRYSIDILDSRDDFDWQLPPPSDPEYDLLVNNSWNKIVLTTPDGATHELRPVDAETYSGTREFLNGYMKNTPTIIGNAVRFYSFDGSYIWAVLYPDGNAKRWEVYLPDGTQIVQRNGGKQKIKDLNGNEIEIRSDTVGSTIITYFQEIIGPAPGVPGREIRYEYTPGVNGTGQGLVKYQTVGGIWVTVTVNFETTYVQGKPYLIGDPNCPDAADLADTDIMIVRSIVLPQTEPGVTRQFIFNYNTDATQAVSYQWRPDCSSSYQTVNSTTKGWGSLRKMTLPTGAWVEYAYNLDIEEDGPPTAPIETVEAPRERIVSKKLTHDGTTDTWTYNISNIGGSVTGPDGSVTIETFYPHDPAFAATYGGADGKGGLVYRTSQSGKVITERHWILKSFTGSATVATGSSQLTPFNPVVDAEYTTVMDASGVAVKMNARTFTHDFNGNVLTVNEYDWFSPTSVSRDAQGVPVGVPAGATLVRTTTNSYHNAATSAGSGNVYAKRDLVTAAPIILNAMQESITGASKAQLSYDGQLYGVAPTLGNVTREARWDNHNNKWLVTTHSYDDWGNRITTTDPNGVIPTGLTTTWTYDSQHHARPVSMTVGSNTTLAQTTTFTYDPSTGLITSHTDPNNNTTETYYINNLTGAMDPFGRPGLVRSPAVTSTIGGISHANQKREVKGIYRDQAREVEVISDLNTQGDGLLRSVTKSDELGRVISTKTSENGSTYTIFTENVYHQMGRVSLSRNPYRNSGESTDGWTRTTADEIGRVVEVAGFSGPIQPPLNGTNGNWTGSVVTIYDGIYTTVTDQAGKQRRSVVDGLGRLVEVHEPDANGNLGTVNNPLQKTSYSYGPLGNLTQVTQGSQQRFFNYDSLLRLRTVKNPEQLMMENVYDYDDAGNLKKKTDPRGVETHYIYDELNRLRQQFYMNDPANTPAVTYEYDSPVVVNSKGRVTKVSSSVSKYEYEQYDALGRVLSGKQTTDGNTYTMIYGYDLAGNMTREVYPSGKELIMSHDDAGRLAGVKNAATGLYYAGGGGNDSINRMQYTAHGAISQMKMGNGLWEHISYNARLQPTRIGLGAGPGSISVVALDYKYGVRVGGVLDETKNNNNVESQEIKIGAANIKQSYLYDPLNRLESVSESVNGVAKWTQSYGYDRYGNRTSLINTGSEGGLLPTQSTPGVNAATNRLVGFGYDNAGNVLSDGLGNTFTYDGENRQVTHNNTSSGTTTYIYDGAGRRVKKQKNNDNTIFVYNVAGQLVAEYATNAPTGAMTPSYLTTDHLGSARVVTDGQGNVKMRRDYLPFGEILPSEVSTRSSFVGYGGEDGIRQKFTGYERDDESGLDYAKARYYSSQQGRFTSVDPLMTSGRSTQPQSWNRYPYTINNPLIYVDPDGLDWWYKTEGTFEGGRINYTPEWHATDPGEGYERWTSISSYVYQDRTGTWWALNPFAWEAEAFFTQESAEAKFKEWTGSGGFIRGTLADRDFLAGFNAGFSSLGPVATWLNALAGIDTTSRDYEAGLKAGTVIGTLTNTGSKIVYRGLAKGEKIISGLIARSPNAGNSPVSHIGGKRASQWISATTDLEVAIEKYGKNGVVAIDLSKVSTEVVDLTKGIPGYPGMLSNWAKKDAEVLIKNSVPAGAITRIK